MGGRVLVTRPEPGASRTAARLRAAGYEPVTVPLSEIVPLQAGYPGGDFAAIVVSSANALRHAPVALVEKLLAKPVFAVGDETAAAARDAGFTNIQSSAGSAVDLVRDIATGAGPAARIAYLCGRVRLDALETDLALARIEIVAIETYDTCPRQPLPQELAELDRRSIAATLVYSAKAAEALVGLVKPRSGTIFRDTMFIAISERVAERLATVASGRVTAATSPSEDSMFDLLSRIGHAPAVFPVNLA